MMRSRRFARLGGLLVLLVLVAGSTGTASGGSKQDRTRKLDDALVKQLVNQAQGSVAITKESATDFVGFVRAGQNGDLLPAADGSPQAKADDFLAQYGAILGAGDAGSTLVETGSVKDSLGATHVSYEQHYNGVPVFGATVIAHLDAANNLTAVNGVAVPNISLDTTPKLSAADAAARAIGAVMADPPEGAALRGGDLRAASTKLYVYRMGLVRGVPGSSQLAYEVEVTNGANVRDFVYVHAHAGKILNRYSTIHNALFRRLFEQNFTPAAQVWQEGDPFPGTLNVDQQNIVSFSGQSYNFFSNAWGRDSYDGAGAQMQTVNNDPRISCPNANWNGITTNYCNGVTSDDVVAHEWGHAYTQFTHDLIYQWQPGALNESYSDIWGETIDLINGAGTDSPSTVRTVGSCSTHTVPVPVLAINSPAAIAQLCTAGAAAFGPPVTAVGTTGDVVVALDDTAAPGPSTTDGCSALTNAAAMAGKIALVDRGGCAFTVKVKNAQNAGAIGAVIANIGGGGAFGMAGGDATITIPSLGISQAHGTVIKNQLATSAVNVTLRLRGGAAPPEDSYRWLMAEDSTAFNPTAPAGGHAIRDMWNPTCLGDPGKVTDAEYHCDTSDAGGVHTNSGVPNHGYALLVDGGTFNGQAIGAIGLVKAAHLYWRAQSVYQTKTTDFDDHADALEASCTDLIGQSLTGLSTAGPVGPSGQALSAADCGQVTKMIAAVELRTDPTEQCNFTPLLDPDAPPVCGDGTSRTLFETTFEKRGQLDGWHVSNEGVYPGWAPPTDWVEVSALPGGRPGSAAYAVDRDGQCDQGAGDRSGVMRMTSPTIPLPRRTLRDIRLTFDHYVATEFGFDGGNVKISVNGGAFAVVPTSAYVFNPYNTTLVSAAGGNTNPLAGEPAFSGTDGGQVTGTWGESQVDLRQIGVRPGDTIRIRFDFGMDGCAGIDGWYVDDITVVECASRRGFGVTAAKGAEVLGTSRSASAAGNVR